MGCSVFNFKKKLTIVFQVFHHSLEHEDIKLRCFPVNIAKFLRKTFFTEHLRWLLVKAPASVFPKSYMKYLTVES